MKGSGIRETESGDSILSWQTFTQSSRQVSHLQNATARREVRIEGSDEKEDAQLLLDLLLQSLFYGMKTLVVTEDDYAREFLESLISKALPDPSVFQSEKWNGKRMDQAARQIAGELEKSIRRYGLGVDEADKAFGNASEGMWLVGYDDLDVNPALLQELAGRRKLLFRKALPEDRKIVEKGIRMIHNVRELKIDLKSIGLMAIRDPRGFIKKVQGERGKLNRSIRKSEEELDHALSRLLETISIEDIEISQPREIEGAHGPQTFENLFEQMTQRITRHEDESEKEMKYTHVEDLLSRFSSKSLEYRRRLENAITKDPTLLKWKEVIEELVSEFYELRYLCDSQNEKALEERVRWLLRNDPEQDIKTADLMKKWYEGRVLAKEKRTLVGRKKTVEVFGASMIQMNSWLATYERLDVLPPEEMNSLDMDSWFSGLLERLEEWQDSLSEAQEFVMRLGEAGLRELYDTVQDMQVTAALKQELFISTLHHALLEKTRGDGHPALGWAWILEDIRKLNALAREQVQSRKELIRNGRKLSSSSFPDIETYEEAGKRDGRNYDRMIIWARRVPASLTDHLSYQGRQMIFFRPKYYQSFSAEELAEKLLEPEDLSEPVGYDPILEKVPRNPRKVMGRLADGFIHSELVFPDWIYRLDAPGISMILVDEEEG